MNVLKVSLKFLTKKQLETKYMFKVNSFVNQVDNITELEPTRFPEPPSAEEFSSSDEDEEDLDPDAGKSQQQVMDELTGQLSLFPDE